MSGWYRSSASPDEVAADAVAAVEAALGPPRRVATLVLPADVSWLDTDDAAATTVAGKAAARRRCNGAPFPGQTVAGAVVDSLARVLRSGQPAALLLGGRALRERGLRVRQAV